MSPTPDDAIFWNQWHIYKAFFDDDSFRETETLLELRPQSFIPLFVNKATNTLLISNPDFEFNE